MVGEGAKRGLFGQGVLGRELRLDAALRLLDGKNIILYRCVLALRDAACGLVDLHG